MQIPSPYPSPAETLSSTALRARKTKVAQRQECGIQRSRGAEITVDSPGWLPVRRAVGPAGPEAGRSSGRVRLMHPVKEKGGAAAPPFRAKVSESVQQLQSKLDLSAGEGGADGSKRGAGAGRVRHPEVGVIQHVEKLRAELKRDGLANREGLVHP